MFGPILAGAITACGSTPAPVTPTVRPQIEQLTKDDYVNGDAYAGQKEAYFQSLNSCEIVEGHPLYGILEKFPYSYPQHDVAGKFEKEGKNVPTSSPVFELAKLSWREIRDELALTKQRELALNLLYSTSTPNADQLEEVREIHDQNLLVNTDLRILWPDLEKTARKMMTAVEKLVIKESKLAKETGAVATGNAVIEKAERLVQIIPKDPLLAGYHETRFDDYPAVEKALEPPPYECDKASAPLERRPSSLMHVEVVRTLMEFANWHLEAAIQRRQAYKAVEAFQRINSNFDPTKDQSACLPKKPMALANTNDELVKGWYELLRHEEDSEGKKGALQELLSTLVYLADKQIKHGEELNRCSNAEVRPGFRTE
ncbi:MAG: hypothetical protein OEY44_00545 [Candidatus Peregrinibacteria bacterium]|nr:hypothetical protein [Candidatus Peregrinibacteria bacterium]